MLLVVFALFRLRASGLYEFTSAFTQEGHVTGTQISESEEAKLG